MSFRVKCSICGSRATIHSSTENSVTAKDLYCICNNPECGHSFVMNLSFSHTLSPSAKIFPVGVLEKIQKANQTQQRELFEALAS